MSLNEFLMDEGRYVEHKALVEEERIETPAIAVIGEVVNLRPRLRGLVEGAMMARG